MTVDASRSSPPPLRRERPTATGRESERSRRSAIGWLIRDTRYDAGERPARPHRERADCPRRQFGVARPTSAGGMPSTQLSHSTLRNRSGSCTNASPIVSLLPSASANGSSVTALSSCSSEVGTARPESRRVRELDHGVPGGGEHVRPHLVAWAAPALDRAQGVGEHVGDDVVGVRAGCRTAGAASAAHGADMTLVERAERVQVARPHGIDQGAVVEAGAIVEGQ